MHVTLLTAGSRGDVQPYVALGIGLREAGHTVRVAAPVPYETLVREHGLEFAPTARALGTLTSGASWQRWQESGDNLAAFVWGALGVARATGAVIESLIDDYWAASQGTDVIISSSSAIGGPQLAEALGVPHCWALCQPMSRTRVFPHFLTPPGLRGGPGFNAWTYRVAAHAYWLLFKPAVTRWVARRTGRRLSRRDLDGVPGAGSGTVLYGFSPRVVPRPPDWGERIVVCGYWFVDAPSGWQPPDSLAAFLRAGPPPVFVALGRIGFSDRDDLLGITVEALTRAGCRGILGYAGGGPEPLPLPETMLRVSDVHYDWLFPRVAAVIHHGGVGTTASALRAGVPSVGIPGFYDQPFWSRRVASLGVGPAPIPRRRLTAARLEAAVVEMTRGQGMWTRAQRLGAAIRGEQGVACAVGRLRAVPGLAGRPC